MTRQLIDNKLQCRDCKQWRLVDDFTVNNAMKHHRDGRCRECKNKSDNLRQKTRYHTIELHRLIQIARARQWNINNPDRVKQNQLNAAQRASSAETNQ